MKDGASRRLSWLSLALGMLALVAVFTLPLLMGTGTGLSSLTVRLVALAPPLLMLMGLITALAARRHEGKSSVTSAALCWNGVLLTAYAVMVIAVYRNPVSPS